MSIKYCFNQRMKYHNSVQNINQTLFKSKTEIENLKEKIKPKEDVDIKAPIIQILGK